jgi:diaminohydroxyphosphoribosylaminopyrimidine deaminase/5-amino-6-(5-phosphoribosylamino)uracil reductase
MPTITAEPPATAMTPTTSATPLARAASAGIAEPQAGFTLKDRLYMRRALTLARRGTGYTSPNPLVGAVLVKDGRIIGEGWHRRYGGKHAEAEAVDAAAGAGESPDGADLYCTLEPCCFTGRCKHQPPCTDLIIKTGISRVFIANRDPHPRVNGEGVRILEKAGIEVRSGLLAEEGEDLNEGFFTYQRLRRPFVHLKIAQSLDGRIAAASGDARWITDEKARRLVHRMRAARDAVLVGRGTVLADDPELTVRLCPGRNPLRVILDSRLALPETAKIFNLPDRERTLVICAQDADPVRYKAFRQKGIETHMVPDNGISPVREEKAGVRDSRTRKGLDPEKVLVFLGRLGIRSVLIEGGSEIFTSFLGRGLFDKISIFIAPIIMGRGVDAAGDLGVLRVADALRLRDIRSRRIGDQTLIEGYRCSRE